MTEELKQVDRSAIEQLVRIRQDEELLRERVAKAEATKAKVSPVVYQRVIADYHLKLDALDRQARPLKDSARREYAKLKALEEQYGKALEDVTIDKEELEFRNQLGEFAEGEFAGKMTELEGKVAEQRSRVDAANTFKNEFLAAFSSEAELDSPAATAAPEPSAPSPQPSVPVAEPLAPPAADARPAVPQTEEIELPAMKPVSPKAPLPRRRAPVAEPIVATSAMVAPAPASAPVETQEEAGSATIATAPVATPAAVSRGVATKPGQSGSTVIFYIPRLVAIVDGQPAEEYVLKSKTSIGRTSKNDIQIFEDSVSRSHCEVVVVPEGYRIIDLGSHNGIVVNGEKVAERILKDGDLLQVGTRQFIFRQG